MMRCMDQRAGLGDVIAATFAAWARWPSTYETLLERERSMYGTADPQEIARLIGAFCVAHLGAGIDASVFYASSQGGASGIVLADGRRVVVKAHAPTWARAALDAVYRTQRALAARQFPCPRPLLAPTRLGRGYATVEELIDEGGDADGHRPAIRRALAETLARLVASARDLRDTAGLRPALLTALPPDVLWPTPHSPIFDLERTAAGAAWIDRLAAEAREMLAHGVGAVIIGHTDWGVQNCRFVGDALRVVYDWDSLARDKETTIVAHAATNFPFNWSLPEPPTGPSADEARAFIEEYEAVRGVPFSDEERVGMAAAATYALAYSARLEHSLYPEIADFPVDTARARLAQYGNAFLRW